MGPTRPICKLYSEVWREDNVVSRLTDQTIYYPYILSFIIHTADPAQMSGGDRTLQTFSVCSRWWILNFKSIVFKQQVSSSWKILSPRVFSSMLADIQLSEYLSATFQSRTQPSSYFLWWSWEHVCGVECEVPGERAVFRWSVMKPLLRWGTLTRFTNCYTALCPLVPALCWT